MRVGHLLDFSTSEGPWGGGEGEIDRPANLAGDHSGGIVLTIPAHATYLSHRIFFRGWGGGHLREGKRGLSGAGKGN